MKLAKKQSKKSDPLVTDQERREAVLKGRLQVCMSIKYIELKISMDLLGATQALGKTIRHC